MQNQLLRKQMYVKVYIKIKIFNLFSQQKPKIKSLLISLLCILASSNYYWSIAQSLFVPRTLHIFCVSYGHFLGRSLDLTNISTNYIKQGKTSCTDRRSFFCMNFLVRQSSGISTFKYTLVVRCVLYTYQENVSIILHIARYIETSIFFQNY